MSVALYRLFLFLYSTGIKIASLFNKKARLWLEGRKNIFDKLKNSFTKNTSPVIWFHCASLGEFEQGRPLLEQLRKDYPTHKILLTFFSPSGYEVHQHYVSADYVFYLPPDSLKNAAAFLGIVQPKLIVFVKYEFWYFYLTEIKKQNIPFVLVSAIFRKNQPFFNRYGTLHRKMLQCFSRLFVQDDSSKKLLESINIKNVSISGDTRVDRVLEIYKNWQPVEKIDEFCNNHQVIVCGSTWEEDDEELNHYVNRHPEIRFIIAPHEIDEDRLKECLHFYKQSILYSDYLQLPQLPENINTVIIDNVGMLNRLYRYASLCFVGGAFGEDGVHNVLEAAVYRKPVVFGNVYDKYLEAVELEDCGAAFPCENTLELEKTFDELFSDNDLYQSACNAAEKYIESKAGATKEILAYIEQKILNR